MGQIWGRVFAGHENRLASATAILLGVAPLLFLKTAGEFEEVPKSAFLQVGAGLLALTWLLSNRTQALRWRPRSLDLAVVAFYAACWASVPQAANRFEALAGLLNWGAAVLLYLLLRETSSGAGVVRRLFVVGTLVGSIVSAVGLAQAWLALDWIPQAAPPASTFANRNMAAHFVVVCLPLAAGTLVQYRQAAARCVGAVGLLLSLAYLWECASVAAWVVSVVLVVVGGCAHILAARGRRGERRRERRRVFALFGVGVLLTGLGFASFVATDEFADDPGLADDLLRMADGGEGTAALRLIFWKNTLAMARDHPLAGVGIGNFKLNYPLYHRAVEIDWTFDEEHQLERAHNDHLQMLAELGIFGLAAWLWIFAAALRTTARCVRSGPDWARGQVLFVALSVLALFSLACFSFPMQRAVPTAYLGALLGLLTFLGDADPAKPAVGSPRRSWGRLGLILVLATYLATAATVARMGVLSNLHLTRAMEQLDRGEPEAAVDALERAVRVRPHDVETMLALARAYAATDRCERALHILDEALRFGPNKVNISSGMAFCQLALSRFSDAERSARKVLELLPDAPGAQVNLGSALFGQGKIRPAIEAYRRAVELAESGRFLPGVRTDSRRLQPRLLLANAYVTSGMWREAIEQYEQVLVLDPARPGIAELIEGCRLELERSRRTQSVQ